MLVSPDYRVQLADPYPVAAAPDLEAVFVGGAPVAAVPGAVPTAVDAARRLGFTPGDDGFSAIPLAFTSVAAFDAAFPADDSWLARGVRDYFSAGGQRAWVVRVLAGSESLIDACVPAGVAGGPPVAPATGLEIAMQVPSAGLVVLPDLEQLCLAAEPSGQALPLPPRPVPAFRPVADPLPPSAPALPSGAAGEPAGPAALLQRISAALAAQRPDMLALFALPIGADAGDSMNRLVVRARRYLASDAGGPNWPQVQALAPLVRSVFGVVASPSGLVAGAQAASARTSGVWRSIAGRALPLGYTPLRRIESNALDQLRSSGVAVLRFVDGRTTLDDDVLALPETDANAGRRAAGTRRLMGWLVRSLRRFGEQLLFENLKDGAPVELILLDLFAALLRRGALNGRQLSDAVTIARRNTPDGAVIFDIGVAAAVAVERIQLRFLDGQLTASLGAAA